MREILFKGFHKTKSGTHEININEEWITGEWVIGLLIKIPNANGEFIYHIQTHKKNMEGIAALTYEIIPETICQFTGLYDNTLWNELSEEEQTNFLKEWSFKDNRYYTKEDWIGKRIWEKDVIQYKNWVENKVFAITWNEKHCGFVAGDGVDKYKDYLKLLNSPTNGFVCIGDMFKSHLK